MEKKSSKNELLLRYVVEFRKRLIHSLFVFSVVFSILLYFANDLYSLLASPLLRYVPSGHGLIATHIVSPIFVPFELAFFVALFITMPIFLHQLWVFIAPGLYRHERRLVWPLLLSSIILFYIGMAFAYFVVFPILFQFLLHTAPPGVTVMPDIAYYLSFTLKLFFIFGIIFEVPMLTILLIWTGLITRDGLIQLRPYVIVAAFILGMLLGPPDVVSQTLLAVPLWLLFELGILLSPLFLQKI